MSVTTQNNINPHIHTRELLRQIGLEIAENNSGLEHLLFLFQKEDS